jgi:DNA topoisomerase IB
MHARVQTEDKSVKWQTLAHNGVLFPPDYTPHGVKMLYDGQPVDLTPQQEEVRPLPTLAPQHAHKQAHSPAFPLRDFQRF